MPKFTLPVLLYQCPLDEGQWLSRALFWPEISTLSATAEAGAKRISRLLQEQATKLDADQIFRRQISGQPEIVTVSLEQSPPAKRTPGWTQALELRFEAIQWQHDAKHCLAWVPELNLEVQARHFEQLAERLPIRLGEALQRSKTPEQLSRLLLQQRAGEGFLTRLNLDLQLPTTLQRAEAQISAKQAERLVMADCGKDLSQSDKHPLPQAFELDSEVQRLVQLLSGRHGRSVLLVGPSGVGKTALIYELVRQRQALKLPWQTVWETSGSRLIAGTTGFGKWQERCQKLVSQARKHQALVLLGNLHELAEVGKGGGSQLGIAGFLRSSLARGELLVMAECTPEQLTLLEREDPQLIEAFSRYDLSPPQPERSEKIIAAAAKQLANQQKIELEASALQTLERLHRRYGSYSVYPGRPLRFLRALMGDLKSGESLNANLVQTRFAAETGLPGFLLDQQQPFDAKAAHSWFEQRVQGQSQAIGPLVDLLALLRTQLTQRHKPLASLMLIGPTGTGKTELSKTLAEFLFGDRRRLLRLDMSEYGDGMAAGRLIGGPGFGSEGLLTSRVREQPFSVILLDELEKAHPTCFDLLLQVLGEGRLTDGRGRTADFTNAVIIMTSNLGAAGFGRPEPGFGTSQAAQSGTRAEAHFNQAVKQFLRPEMYNRIDRIIPFYPLDQTTVRSLAKREWQKALNRDGLLTRPIQCQVSEAVFEQLALKGWDPRYGARPLKRTLEREVLVPLSEALNRYPLRQELEARLELVDGVIQVEVKGRQATAPVQMAMPISASQLRRRLQQLRLHPLVQQLDNQLLRIRQLKRQIERRPRQPLEPEQQRELQAYSGLNRLLELLNQIENRCQQLELSSWQTLFREAAPAETEIQKSKQAELSDLRQSLESLVLGLYQQQFSEPNRVCLTFISTDYHWLSELVQNYVKLAEQRQEKVVMSVYQPLAYEPVAGQVDESPEQKFYWRVQDKALEWLHQMPRQVLALALEWDSEGARAFYHQEAGRHLYQFDHLDRNSQKSSKNAAQVLIQVSDRLDQQSSLLPGGQLRAWIEQQPLRRSFFVRDELVKDEYLAQPLTFPYLNYLAVLSQAMGDLLKIELQKIWLAEESEP